MKERKIDTTHSDFLTLNPPRSWKNYTNVVKSKLFRERDFQGDNSIEKKGVTRPPPPTSQSDHKSKDIRLFSELI